MENYPDFTKKKLRHIGFGIILVSVVTMCLGAGLSWYLNTDTVCIRASTALSRCMAGSVTIQRHHVSLIEQRLDLWNVRILDPARNKIAACRHIVARISPISLLLGKLRIRSLQLDGPQVILSVDASGTSNWTLAAAYSSSPSAESETLSATAIGMMFRKISITDGCLRYEDPSRALSAEMEGIRLNLSGDVFARTGRMNMHIAGGFVSTPDAAMPIGSLSLETVLKNGRLAPFRFTVASPSLNATISGDISRLFSVPRLHLTAAGDTCLDGLRPLLKTSARFSGKLHASAAISGSLYNPEASIVMTGNTIEAAGYPLKQFRAAAHLKDRNFVMEPVNLPAGKGSIRITADADLKKAFPSGFFRPSGHVSAISGHLLLSLDAVDMAGIHASSSGVVNGTVSIRTDGAADRPFTAKLRADIHARHFSWCPPAAPVDVQLHCESTWEGRLLHIARLSLQSGATHMTASGAWTPHTNAISGDLDFVSDDLSRSLTPLGFQNTSGSLQAVARFYGVLNRPEYSVQLKTRHLAFGGVVCGDMDIDAAMNASGALHISRLSIDNQGSEITGKGDVQVRSSLPAAAPEHFTLVAAFHHLDPRHFLRTSRVYGELNGDFRLDGAGKTLTGTLQVQGKDIAVNTIRIGNVNGAFRLAKGLVQIQRLSLQNGRSEAELSGEVQLFEPGGLTINPVMPFHLTETGNNLHLEDFIRSMKGDVALNAALKGNLKQMSGNVSLESAFIDTGYQKLKSVRITAEFDHHRLTLSGAHAEVAAGEPIDASGWLAADRTFHLELVSGALSLAHIDVLAGKWPVDGRLHLTLTGNGQLDHPRITGSAILDPFRWDSNNWGKSLIQVNMADDLAQIRIRSPILCTATYQIRKKDFTADITLAHADLRPFLRMAGVAWMDGRISGTVNTSGNLDRPDALKADARFSHVLLEAKGAPIVEGHNLQFVFRDGAIVIPQSRLALLQGGAAILSGSIRPGRSFALGLSADLPLHAVGVFQKTLAGAKGDLTASAQVQGPWTHPNVEATVDLRQAGLPLYATTQEIHDVTGQIRITPHSIAVKHFNGRLDNGRFQITGKALLNAWRIQTMNFHLVGDSLPVSVPDTLDMRLNTDLILQGAPQSAAIQGNIVLVEGSYYKDVNLNPLKALMARNRSFQAQPDIVFPAAIQNTRLDIRIPPQHPFLWDNNLAQLRLSPDMRITGTLQHPVVLGRTRIDSGTLQYQSNTFMVKRGFIDFTHLYTLDTVLDIQSQATIRNWTVFLDVSGPMNQLNLKLSSSPFLDDNDLLSLLIMGKTARTALPSATGQPSSSQKMLADLLSASVGSDLKKISGLDILDVNTNGQSRYVTSDPLKVTLGKVISPQITLKYTVENRQGETVQTTIAEYQLVENLLLSGFQDNQGTVGGELEYRHAFR